MTTFRAYILRKTYKSVQKNGNGITHIDSLTDQEDFRPTINPPYRNKTSKGGRPNVDELVMVKILVLARARVYSVLRNMFNSRGHYSRMSMNATYVKSWIPWKKLQDWSKLALST